MDNDIAIKVNNVSKNFKLPHEKTTTVKSAVVNFYRRKRTFEKQQVLKGISFDVKNGEFFGIIGRNGSGKSTLLKLLAGIYNPDGGEVEINGKLTPFIELGVGFNAELTGRENVFLNGALLGFSRKEMDEMYDGIVEFAELENFMDQKLKNYSSGMQVRLAFSIAIRAKSDILLVDEVLAVGDASFQAKCFEYFRTLKQKKQTVIFVSHDRGAVQEFCERGILIDSGNMVKIGEIKKVLQAYDEISMDRLDSAKPSESDRSEKPRRNPAIAEVINCEVMRDGSKTKAFMPREEITIKVSTRFNKDTEKPVYGIVINRVGESYIFATNTNLQKIETQNVKAGEVVVVTYTFGNILGNGRYEIAPAVASQDTRTMYDWHDAMTSFTNIGWEDNFQPVHINHTININ